MRLLDRYVVGIFLSALLVFAISFLALFLIVDFSTRLPRFLALERVAILPFILKYYLVRLPLFLLYVLPTVSLFAAMFAMVKLQKSNEIVPIVTSGVSMHRIAMPFVILSVLVAGVAFSLDEYVLPDLMTTLADTDEILASLETTQKVVQTDTLGNHVTAGEYDHVRKILKVVTVTRLWENNLNREIIHAKAGRWDPDRRRWMLSAGEIQFFDTFGNPETILGHDGRPMMKKQAFDEMALEGCLVTPENLQRRLSLAGDYDTIGSLVTKIREEPQKVGWKLALHAKFSFPLSCVVLLLLGLPFSAETQVKAGVIRGLMMCLIVTAAYYAVHFILINRAQRQQVNPVIASWAATAIFGALGIVNYTRMKS